MGRLLNLLSILIIFKCFLNKLLPTETGRTDSSPPLLCIPTCKKTIYGGFL